MRAGASCGGSPYLDSNTIKFPVLAAALLALPGLAATAPAQPELATIIAAVGDVKAFRMRSGQFDALVAPSCKKTDQSAGEYRCWPNTIAGPAPASRTSSSIPAARRDRDRATSCIS